MATTIGLFIPCYVNALYPNVGKATYKLLKHLGYEVDYPEKQTCCGQPMGNAGFEEKATPLATHFLNTFQQYDYIVAPSASCVSFVKDHYTSLLGEDHIALQSVLSKVYEVCIFLKEIAKIDALSAHFAHKVSLQNSCHGVRTLGMSSATERNISRYSVLKDLLSLVKEVEIVEPERSDECCGFGGLFCIEEPDISGRMGKDKIERHIKTGAAYITGADSSCLMHLQGIIDKYKYPIKTVHIAEILSTDL